MYFIYITTTTNTTTAAFCSYMKVYTKRELTIGHDLTGGRSSEVYIEYSECVVCLDDC
jgi:hypothetical protein